MYRNLYRCMHGLTSITTNSWVCWSICSCTHPVCGMQSESVVMVSDTARDKVWRGSLYSARVCSNIALSTLTITETHRFNETSNTSFHKCSIYHVWLCIYNTKWVPVWSHLYYNECVFNCTSQEKASDVWFKTHIII